MLSFVSDSYVLRCASELEEEVVKLSLSVAMKGLTKQDISIREREKKGGRQTHNNRKGI